MLQRIVQREAGEHLLAVPLADDEGRPLEAESVAGTVTVSDGAGTEVWEGEPQLGAGVLAASVPAAAMPLPDTYAVAWDVVLDGEVSWRRTSHAELCGARLFSLGELQAAYAELATVGDAELEAARLAAEQRLEQAAGVAFVPRGGRWAGRGSGTWRLLLPVQAALTGVVSVTVDGEAYAGPLAVREWGALDREDGSAWPEASLVAVHYLHGLPLPVPEPVRVAAMVLAREYVVRSALSSRATVEATDVGFFRLSVADGAGRPTGIPEVDAVVAAYGRRRPAVG